jgi:hypothetical protein
MPFRRENRQTKFSGSRFATKKVAVKKIMPFRHENRQTKFSGSRFATKKVAVKKNHAVSLRKQTNQIFGKPFCHEKT